MSKCFNLTVFSIETVLRFHNAAREGDVSLVERLLQEGVPVDCVDEDDTAGLSLAAQYNRTDVIRLLLQKGADVNKRNRIGGTLAHWAAYGKFN